MNGLTTKEVEFRIKNGLVNKRVKYSRSIKDIILSNIFTLFNFINLFLFILVLTTKSYRNGLFAIVIVINTIISIYGEIKAKLIIDKLSIVNNTKVSVIRDGKTIKISPYDIVVDDIIILKNGDVVPTDVLVLNSNLCEVDESIITGETKNVIKKKNDTIFSGSIIISGSLKAKVINVGLNNYSSRLIKEASYQKEEKTYLEKELNKVLKIVTILIIPIMIILFLIQYFVNNVSYNEAILYTTAGVIGMIPSGLILLTSVALSTGVIKMGLKKVIVQELNGIETLSCVDVLCLDKTGTITDGTLEVIKVINKSTFDINSIIKNMLNDNLVNQTDIALDKYFKTKDKLNIVKMIPFSSYRKYSMVCYENLNTFALGALEYMLPNTKMDEEALNYAQEGYRVLTLIHSKEIPEDQKIPSHSKIIAYIILKDNIRKNIEKTLKYFTEQQVNIKIISGDNVSTISNIMKKVGYKDYKKCLDCSNLNDEELIAKVSDYQIYGRCNPYQKRLIIKTLKQKYTVGMVGDGVNDILALKEADCSIALTSNNGAAKSVSQIVILENDFNVLPDIVNEGRRVINNIERVASLYLVKTIYSFLLSILSIVLTMEYPFYPIQLTLIGTACVGLPSFFLTMLNDNRKVSKNFIKNVFKTSSCSGIAITINIIIILILSNILKTSIDTYKIVTVTLTGLINILILYKISKPITNIKKIILLITIVLFLSSLIFLRKIFILNKFNLNLLIITIAILIFDIIIIKYLEKLYDKIFQKRWCKWMHKKEWKN